jgi:alkylhydroperoxidase/carboxymuconolactone decarboxylase family protein YurZ
MNENILNILKEISNSLPDKVRPVADKFPDILEGYLLMRNKLMGDGALDRKTKVLMALSIATAMRLNNIFPYYIPIAYELGAKKEEIKEAIGVGIVFSGGAGFDIMNDIVKYF